MKHIKPYNIFESQEQPQQHPGFPETEEEINWLCKFYRIENYTINNDLSIDVEDNVSLSYYNLEYIPLKFNYVGGDFYCSGNELTTLKNAPNTVGGSFDCYNNRLTSLKYAPHTVGGNFMCSKNELTSLKGAPNTLGSGFECHNNELISLKYLPNGVDYKSYYTRFNNNPIYTLINTFIENDNVEDLIPEFNEYSIVRGDKVILNRLKTFIRDFDLGMPNLVEVKEYYEIV